MTLLIVFMLGMDQVDEIVLKRGWRLDLSVADLYRCRALAVADNGTVAAIDRDEGQIVLISADGTFKKRIDRSGEGPGELQSPVEISWSRPHGAFGVLDFGNSRISLWDTDGSFITETSYSGRMFQPFFPNKKSVFLARNPGALDADPTLVRMDLKTGELTELWRYAAKPHEWTTIGDSGIRVRFRWDAKLSYGLGGSFIAVTFGDMNRIVLLDLRGKPTGQSIPVKLPVFEITDSQIEEGIVLMPLDVHQGLRQGLKRPERWPLIREIFVDDKNRIWVIGSSREVKAPHPFLVFNAAGKALGRGESPRVPLAITGEALYLLDQNAEDALILEKMVFQI